MLKTLKCEPAVRNSHPTALPTALCMGAAPRLSISPASTQALCMGGSGPAQSCYHTCDVTAPTRSQCVVQTGVQCGGLFPYSAAVMPTRTQSHVQPTLCAHPDPIQSTPPVPPLQELRDTNHHRRTTAVPHQQAHTAALCSSSSHRQPDGGDWSSICREL